MTMARAYSSLPLVAAFLALGCQAEVAGAPAPGTGSAGAFASAGQGGGTDPAAEPSAWQPGVTGDPKAAGPMPLRQLNRTEYRNAVNDLFGDALEVERLLPGDVAGTSGFATPGLASEVTVQAFQQASERLAAAANLATLSGCSAESTCLGALLDGFARHAFRRPLTPAERAEYTALYGSLIAEVPLPFEAAARGVIEAVLQSPAFLYHWELGPQAPTADAGGVVKLGGYELASRLSFLLWSSIPDDELLSAAAGGGLESAEGVAAQARRLLASDKAAGALRSFGLQWLEITLDGATKSAELYPSFTPSLARAMQDELVSLSMQLYRSGSVRDLFQSRDAWVTPELAPVYGVAAGASGPSLALLSAERPGLLTRAGFLASTSNAYEGDPTKRGVVIRRRVLCGTLAPPPANIPALPAPTATQSVRERHALHMQTEPCKTCHTLTDPIGFGLGNFDAIGAYRAEEAGKTIDVSGSVSQLDGAERAFTGPAELMSLLAESEQVRACLTKQWLRFAFSRGETRADDATLEGTYRAFESAGFKLSELLVGLSQSRSFRYRSVSPGGGGSMSQAHRFSRRALLSSLGVGAALLPLLSSRPGRSQNMPPPKRFIAIAVPNGVKEEVYWPQGTSSAFTIPLDAEVPAAHRFSPLQPLREHQRDIIFLGGLALQNGRDSNGGSLGGHAALPFLLTGARGVPGPEISDAVKLSASVPSIDRFIGKELAKRHGLKFDSLVLNPVKRFRGNDGYLSFDGPPVGDSPDAPQPRVDPYAMFDEMFGGTNLGKSELELLRKKRKSVLDLVGRQLEGWSENLGRDDRQRIEAHLESVRAIERQLDALSATCVPPVLTLDKSADYLNDNGNAFVHQIIKAQSDLLVAALACDLTRVASMLWMDQGNVRWVFHWLGAEFTKPGTDFANNGENQGLRNHHEIAHKDGDPEYQPLMNRGCQWFLEQYAYLLARLKATPDVNGGTLFDNSVALFANLQRTGGGHHTDNLPWILAGSCGGYFKTGRFYAWPSGKNGQNVPQNGVLAAICNAMDVPVDYYGDADYGGELSLLRG